MCSHHTWRLGHGGHAGFTEFNLDGVEVLAGNVQAGDGIGHGAQDGPKARGAARVSLARRESAVRPHPWQKVSGRLSFCV